MNKSIENVGNQETLKFIANSSDATIDKIDKVMIAYYENLTYDILSNAYKVIDGIINDTIQAAQSACILMHDTQGELSNAIIYPNPTIKDNAKKPFLFANYKGEAIVLGDKAPQQWAVLGINNAIALHQAIKQEGNIQVITLPNELKGCFTKMIRTFKPSHVFTTLDCLDGIMDDLKEKMADYNGVIYAGIGDLETSLLVFDYDLTGFISDESTKVIRLETWDELGSLSQHGKRGNTYPLDWFAPSLREVVERLAYHAQVPLSMAGQAVLGALSTIGQAFINAPFSYGHQPSSLFLLTQAKSGGGKSTVSKYAYKAISEHDKQMHQQFSEQMQEYIAQVRSLKGEEKANFIINNPKPVDKKLITSDATIERILDKYVIDGIKNLSWTSSEAGKFFGGHTMQTDTQVSACGNITALYDGQAVNRERSQRNTDIWQTTAYDCRFTFDLSGQPIVIEAAFSDALIVEQGLLPRFLLSCEPTLQGSRDWASEERLTANVYSDEVLNGFWTRCKFLLSNEPQKHYANDYNPFHDPDPDRDSVGRVNMPFATGARKCLAQFQQSVEVRQRSDGDLCHYTAFASRMAENASRIATLQAFYDGKIELEIEYLERAFKLVEYSVKEFINYHETNHEELNDAEKLIVWLVNKRKTQKTGELPYSICQSQVSPKHLRKKNDFETLTNALIETNHIKIQSEDDKRFIIINPKLLE